MVKKDLKENVAFASIKNLRVSPTKLNLVADLIRGLSCSKAVHELIYSKKRIAKDVKKLVESAVANAENNHNMDIDKLFIHEVFVGKGLVMKRFMPRAKGRGVRILKPFSHIKVVVAEKGEL